MISSTSSRLTRERYLSLRSKVKGLRVGQADVRQRGVESAGTLASGLLSQIAALGADPGNFVEREFITRGLLPPGTPQSIPISGLINDIIEQLRSGSAISDIFNQQTAPTAETAAPQTGTGGTSGVGAQGTGFPPEAQAVLDAAVKDAATANAAGAAQTGADAAGSGVSTSSLTEQQLMAPLTQFTLPDDPSQFESASQSPASGGTATMTAGGGVITGLTPEQIAAANASNIIPGLAHGGTTNAPISTVGDAPPGSNKENPEALINPTGAPIMIIPLSQAMKGAPRFFGGTASDFGDVQTTPDESIQALPTLRFLQGQGTPQQFGQLATGTTPGAFGTDIPEAGSININRLAQIARDPTAIALLSSLFRSASRNLGSEASRAQARAPVGQNVISSLIRT